MCIVLAGPVCRWSHNIALVAGNFKALTDLDPVMSFLEHIENT